MPVNGRHVIIIGKAKPEGGNLYGTDKINKR